MKSVKITLSALLLGLSLGAFAQDEDELLGTAAEEDAAEEVFVPSTPIEKKFFQRVQLGYLGTIAKYRNDGNHQPRVPDSEDYFLSGVGVGWIGDLSIAKKFPLYLELGGMLTYHTGRTKDNLVDQPATVGGFRSNTHYRIQALSLTIPVTVTYQFREFMGVEDFTLAPVVGPYARFNIVANRWETKTTEDYIIHEDGTETVTGSTFSRTNKSLMEDNLNGHNGWMEGRTHKGNLVQVGVLLGANAFYKNFSFGLAYMLDLTPFASHDSPTGMSYNDTAQGGRVPIPNTGCDMKATTTHNFALTFGYVF